MPMSQMPSLFGVLQKAQPRWSISDICRVQEKLHKVNIVDLQTLGNAVMEGSLNSSLGALGERRLKQSTLAQLRIQVRGPYRAAQLAQETVSTNATRSCFCGKCLLSASSRAPASCESTLGGAVPTCMPPRIGLSGASHGQNNHNHGHKASANTAYAGAEFNWDGDSSNTSPAPLRKTSLSSLQQAAGQIVGTEKMRRVQSEPFMPRKVRIDESSIGQASDSSPSSLKVRSGRYIPNVPPGLVSAKSRSGALNLPQVPGGMRPDDDALHGLLRAAESRLKRGFIKAKIEEIPEDEVALSTAPNFSGPTPSDEELEAAYQAAVSMAQRYDLSMAQHLEQPMAPTSADSIGGDSVYTQQSTQLSDVRTIERADGYTSTSTAMSRQAVRTGVTPERQRNYDRQDSAYTEQEEPCSSGTGDGEMLEERGLRTASAATYGTYSDQYSDQYSDPGGSISPDSGRSREASPQNTAVPFRSLRPTDGSAASAPQAHGDFGVSPGAKGDVPGSNAPSNLVPPRNPAAEASLADSGSSATGARRRPADPASEAARESRRARWINAYNGGSQQGGSHSSSAYSIGGHTGYSFPSSSAGYSATSGTSVGRRS